MTPAAPEPSAPHVAPRAVAAFAALVVATALELWVAVGMTGVRTTRVGALIVLLTAKAAIVLTALMGWRHRRTAVLTVVAIASAVVFTVVLMMEAAFRARVG